MELSFTSLAIVAATGFVAPLALGLAPRLRLPSVVLELVLGILIGPSVLGWAKADEPVQIMSLIGLSFLLLIAGLEVDYDRLAAPLAVPASAGGDANGHAGEAGMTFSGVVKRRRSPRVRLNRRVDPIAFFTERIVRGRLLEVTGIGFLVSFGIALVIGFGLQAAGIVHSALLIAIMFSATGLGIVIAVLKDAGAVESPFGQLVIAGSSIAEVATIVLLTLFFSGESNSVGVKLVLLGLFGVLCVVVILAALRIEHSMRLMQTLVRLQDTTAQIRVRGAFVLLAIFVVLASKFGLEAILGAFLAGAILKFIDRDQAMTHPQFRLKLEAAGFGVFIPFFFVTSGIRYDAGALFHDPATLARVPLFLAILLLVRGVPALLYRPLVSTSETAAGALLQATSVGFFVVASRIGQDMGLISAANSAALIAAGLLSVVVFPLGALVILRRRDTRAAVRDAPAAAAS
jgi:Kef-type K+ transport system membrane component KefB